MDAKVDHVDRVMFSKAIPLHKRWGHDIQRTHPLKKKHRFSTKNTTFEKRMESYQVLHLTASSSPKNTKKKKRTWQWKITTFNRRYIFIHGVSFHCHVSFPGCIHSKPLKLEKTPFSFSPEVPQLLSCTDLGGIFVGLPWWLKGGETKPFSKNFPTYPWNIPQTLNSLRRNSFHLGVWGCQGYAPGVIYLLFVPGSMGSFSNFYLLRNGLFWGFFSALFFG